MTSETTLQGRRLVAVCPEDLTAAAQGLLAKLKELHERGPSLHPGSVIDFGWTPLRILAADDAWIVCEPDFSKGAGAAQHFLPKVGVTLRVLDDQARIIRLLGVRPVVARFDQTVLVSKQAWQADRIVLDRGETKAPGYSGWSIGPNIDDEPQASHPGGQAITVGELAILHPPWMAVLALPFGFLAKFNGDHLTAIFDEHSRQVAAFIGDGHETAR